MKCIVNNQVVLSRPPEGPVAAHIGSFAESVSEQGYSLWVDSSTGFARCMFQPMA